MNRIAIVGGHGKIALLLSKVLTERGDAVTSIIRNPDHIADVEATGATALVADVENLDTAGIAAVIDDHDAIVWSAGAGGGNPARTYAVDRDAAIRAIDAARQSDVNRFVMVSYLGARPDHGVPEDSGFFPYAEAKAAADEYLRGSGLDWTILQPSRLTDEAGTGRIAVSDEPGEVPRQDVAAVAARVLDRADTVHVSIPFIGGSAPIDAVLDAAR